MTKELILHHYTRSAVWPEGMFQCFVTTTVKDADGSIVAVATEDKRLTSPRVAAALRNLDAAILKELGAEAKHVELLDNKRLPQEVRDALDREAAAKGPV